MAIGLQPIYTQTVGAGGASSVTFNNIPQTFTDLKIEISTRMNNASTLGYTTMKFNNDSSNANYSWTYLDSNIGSTPFSSRATPYFWFVNVPGANMTANVFGASSVYIPNYSGGQFKQGILEATGENNGTQAWLTLYSGSFRSTSPITSITFNDVINGASFLAGSTISLYGITKG